MSAPVSVVVITKNEESNIRRCLKSVEWAPQRIVVDARSTDRTEELARGMGAQVFRREWPGYGAQRNFAIDQATQPWVLSIDADEEVTGALAAEIEQTLGQDISESAFRLFVPTYFMGQPLKHYGRAPRDPGHIRLFRRDRGRYDDRIVHEQVKVDGKVGVLCGPVLHHCYPNLASYWRKIHYYAHLEAQDRAARDRLRGNRWVRAAGKLAWMLFWRRGILDGPPAWLWIAGQAYQEWLITGEASRLRHKEGAHGTA